MRYPIETEAFERHEPARPASFAADVLVPGAQALLTGALVAGLVTFGAGQLWDDPAGLLKLWGGLTLAGTAGSWLLLLRDSRALLWSLERLTGRDLDGDGTRGDPAKRRLEVHVKTGGTTRIVGADWLGLDDANLIAFAEKAEKRHTLSEGAWGKDRAAFPRGMNQFRAVRAKLQDAGMIRLVNASAKNGGYEWTPAGRAMVRRIVESCTHTHTQERSGRRATNRPAVGG